MKKINILIIDDEKTINYAISKTLEHYGYSTTVLHSKKEVELLSGNTFFNIAFLDLKLPDGNGLDLITGLKKKFKNIQIIVMTGYGTIDLAVEATKKGAFHFITKPFNNGEILNLSEKALSHSQLENENARLKSFIKKQYKFDKIIGQSHVILQLLETIKRISSSPSTVLITGESGTGKELIAKSIHFNSTQSQGPFVPVHCGAIPKDLLESELFGHIKGSFTGAVKDRVGRFQMAEEGTLFLDEISTMELSTQVKLLRVLQEKEFQPVGSEKIITTNARVIAASNDNLEVAVKQGTFRKDLFYRLNVIPVHVPPLRERTSDIPILIKHFIKEFSKTRTTKIKEIDETAIKHLANYSWPGNIRELENLIERLCVLKVNDRIVTSDLPSQYQSRHQIHNNAIIQIPESGLNFNSLVASFENELILKALRKTNWNRNQAAKLLQLNRTTLLEKIKKKGIKEDIPPIL